MPLKQWWTVFAVYDENEEPYIKFVQADDKAEARSKALRQADGVILIAGIAPGRVQDADVEGLDNVVPIRGKEHAIEVTHVRVTKRKIVVPGHCPKCKTNLRRAGAIIETLLDKRTWLSHLSSNGKDIVGEKVGSKTSDALVAELVTLDCAQCHHVFWEGLHAD
jgi:hypothetical protein